MSNRLSTIRTLTFAGVALLATVAPAATPSAEAETAEQLTWLRLSSCSRAERSTGSVDADGDCVGHHPAIGDDVVICAGHFCPAKPGEPGARIIHPSDFGQTD